MKTKLFLIVSLSFVVFCGQKGGEKLTIYSSRGEKFTKPIVEAFQAKTGIATEFQFATEAELLLRLSKEGERTMADIFMTTYAGTLEEAREKGLLQSYESPNLKGIPAQYQSKDKSWVAASARARVAVYNKNHVKPDEIRSLLDLADEKWNGRLGITVSTNNSFVGGLATFVSLLGEEKAREFLLGLKRNAGENIFPKHTPIVNAVANGDIHIGLVNNYYFYRKIAAEPDAPVGILYLDQDDFGSPVTVTGVAILKHARHKEKARAFVDFVLSEEGQEIYAKVNFEFPVREGTARHELLPKPGAVKFAKSEKSADVANMERAKSLIKETGMR